MNAEICLRVYPPPGSCRCSTPLTSPLGNSSSLARLRPSPCPGVPMGVRKTRFR